LDAFVFSSNKFSPERQRQKVVAFAYAEILFAERQTYTITNNKRGEYED
jgi:hypothetical protein